ncbi:MAG: hypothetical protein Q4C48_06825 [Lachnospiraceae bacterium]|nr:hypothetical protein [Lachnospiraceae bacterium]
MKTYIYPENLQAKSQKWLWTLPCLGAIALFFAASVLVFMLFGTWLMFGITAGIAVVSIQVEGNSLLLHLRVAIRFFFTQQEYFQEVED